jgi:Flp pilus assembly protein TadD
MMRRPIPGAKGLLLALILAGPVVASETTPTVAVAGVPAAATTTAPDAERFAALPVIDQAIADGRLEAARDIIARTAAVHDSPELRLRAAELALANSALVEAATSFSDLIAFPKANAALVAAAHQGLGLVRLREGNLAAAQSELDAAVAADPSLVRAWMARGVVADRQRDFDRADIAYARAIALAPNSALALTNRGYSLLLRGRYADAEKDLARAVAIDPGVAAARTNLRLARAMQGRYREAFADSTKAGLAADLNTVGFAAMTRGDYPTAETYFNRAISLNTRFDKIAWANLRYLKSITAPMEHGPRSDDLGAGEAPAH